MLYKMPDDMTYEEWRANCREREQRLTHGAERIPIDHAIYDVFFSIDKICFNRMFNWLPVYWKPADAPKDSLGMYKDNHIMIERDFYEKHGMDDDVINLMFHEMLHAFCDWKRIKDVEGKYHLKEFLDAAQRHGGAGDVAPNEFGFSNVYLSDNTMKKIKNRIERRGQKRGNSNHR